MLTFVNTILNLIKIIFLLTAVVYFTISERKVMGASQRRHGFDVVSSIGLLQPLADALKLIQKEIIILTTKLLFILEFRMIFALNPITGTTAIDKSSAAAATDSVAGFNAPILILAGLAALGVGLAVGGLFANYFFKKSVSVQQTEMSTQTEVELVPQRPFYYDLNGLIDPTSISLDIHRIYNNLLAGNNVIFCRGNVSGEPVEALTSLTGDEIQRVISQIYECHGDLILPGELLGPLIQAFVTLSITCGK